MKGTGQRPLQHLRMSSNDTDLGQVSFILIGIPGLEAFQCWIAIPLCSMYILTLVGNCTLLFIIKTETSLHKPMYLFLSMLAINDLILTTSTVPKMLGIFWLNSREISFNDCLVQMYFIHTFSMVESSILLAMAFDRYVAICDPLRYATILSNSAVAKMGLAGLFRGMILVMPCPFLIRRLPYCSQKVIQHTYCEHMAMVKLSCGDTIINRIYGICAALFVIVLDMVLIAASYTMILRAVFRVPSKEACAKALSTCAAHACTILVTYTPALFTFLTHRIGRNVPPYIHILLGSLYLLVPPMVNPLVYGVKTREIRDKVLSMFNYSKKLI
ncbi:olfactory receptor 52K1-like [Alligator mississippiensis]|uniref:Olfactory receptor n=2 Tax=Alligator mississippiensis TaxID=8496 RepID=A0A151P6K2_ALLMI|nr:olfactory receptor 52K1-like [Alligator mississippiensis]KYO44529.1 olfactory receptor 52K1-like [Alligator mississippiensis]